MNPCEDPFIGIDGSFPLYPSFPSVWATSGMVHVMVDGRCLARGSGKALHTYPTILTQVGTYTYTYTIGYAF